MDRATQRPTQKTHHPNQSHPGSAQGPRARGWGLRTPDALLHQPGGAGGSRTPRSFLRQQGHGAGHRPDSGATCLPKGRATVEFLIFEKVRARFVDLLLHALPGVQCQPRRLASGLYSVSCPHHSGHSARCLPTAVPLARTPPAPTLRGAPASPPPVLTSASLGPGLWAKTVRDRHHPQGLGKVLSYGLAACSWGLTAPPTPVSFSWQCHPPSERARHRPVSELLTALWRRLSGLTLSPG